MEYKFNFIGYQNYPHQVLFDFFYMYFKDNEKAAFFMVTIQKLFVMLVDIIKVL